MLLAEYLAFILVFVLGMHTFRICLSRLREVCHIGGSKSYRYTAGVIVSVGLILLAVVGVFFVLFRPFH